MSTLKAGSPRNKTQKEISIESVKELDEVSEKTQRLNVEIPASLKRDLKVRAAQDGLKLNELTIKLIKDYLSKDLNEVMK